MSWVTRLVTSSIGKKLLMGLTGLALSVFLIGHLGGNLLVFVGKNAYNRYGALLEANPFLGPIELALLAVFLLHVVLGIRLTIENRLARPDPYELRIGKGAKTVANNNMLVTGVIIAVFIFLHVAKLKYFDYTQVVPGAPPHMTTLEGISHPVRDFFLRLQDVFSSFPYVVWYVVAVGILGLHVSHGLQSSCRSLGLYNRKYSPGIDMLSIAFGLLVGVGYALIPLWFQFFQRGG